MQHFAHSVCKVSEFLLVTEPLIPHIELRTCFCVTPGNPAQRDSYILSLCAETPRDGVKGIGN